MTSEQSQSVGSGGQAIQAGGDVTVGVSPAQMMEMMERVVVLSQNYQAEALTKVEERMAALRNDLLAEFAKPGRANPEAMKQPDFQYMLGEAQEAYARSGSAEVKDTLVDIIARRSTAPDHSREALTLNDAAARAPKLTASEFAILSLAYICRYTVRQNINSLASFNTYVSGTMLPFLIDASVEQSSFWHILAQSCGTISMGSSDLRAGWVANYGGVLGKGVTLVAMQNSVPEDRRGAVESVLVPCLRDPSLVQPNAITSTVFRSKAGAAGLVEDDLQNIWNTYANSIPPEPELVAMLEPDIPGVSKLFDYWKDTPIKSLDLNSVGVAIAHANAVRVVKFDAPLSIWIK